MRRKQVALRKVNIESLRKDKKLLEQLEEWKLQKSKK